MLQYSDAGYSTAHDGPNKFFKSPIFRTYVVHSRHVDQVGINEVGYYISDSDHSLNNPNYADNSEFQIDEECNSQVSEQSRRFNRIEYKP